MASVAAIGASFAREELVITVMAAVVAMAEGKPEIAVAMWWRALQCTENQEDQEVSKGLVKMFKQWSRSEPISVL